MIRCCSECGKKINNNNISGLCRDCLNKRKQIKTCKICGVTLNRRNKSGFCIKHYDKSGDKNPFYKKHHSEETKKILEKKCKEATIKMWKNDEYRNKVIKEMSKPRDEKFKKEQSKRIKQWYKDNPIQREIRSIYMKEYWQNETIACNLKDFYYNKSKNEIEIFNILCNEFGCDSVNNDAILYLDKNKKKWLIPDINIFNSIIIEYYGDYWHCNPLRYESTFINEKNKLMAIDIWNYDKKRVNLFKKLNYDVIIIWELAYKKYKDDIINNIDYELKQKDFKNLTTIYNLDKYEK